MSISMEPFDTYLKYMKWSLISCGYWPFLTPKFILFHLIFIGILDFTWTLPIVRKNKFIYFFRFYTFNILIIFDS